MTDYLEANITGRKWRRCSTIEIYNSQPPDQVRIRFKENDVIDMGDSNLVVGSSFFDTIFDPTKEFPVLDTDNLEPTGETSSEGALYVLLFSKYIAAAKERDEKILADAAAKEAAMAAINNIQPASPL